jgi:hypothetical protein
VRLLGRPPPATGAPPRRTTGSHGRGSEAGIRPTSGAAVKLGGEVTSGAGTRRLLSGPHGGGRGDVAPPAPISTAGWS